MSDPIKCDLCVIGAGSGGLSVAAGASQMGASVVLIEKDKMGGDCLNTGCVPSKALLAAAHAVSNAKKAEVLGIKADVSVDGAKVFAHVRGVIDGIAPHDSQERFEDLGVRVIRDVARFVSPTEVDAGGTRIRARRFVIATGSRAFVPPVPGIENANVLTNENVFELTEIPRHLIVIGGGPIGIELAQAFKNLGCEVTVVEMFTIMPKDDPELVNVVRQCLFADGVRVMEGVKVVRIEGSPDAPQIVIEDADGHSQTISGTHLLVAAGRRPNVEDLGLEEAGVQVRDAAPGGIIVNKGLKTSNKKIYAIGDVAGGLQFTHVAGYHAGIVIRSALFRLPAKAKHDYVPWVTYTDPELAQAGMTEAQAREAYGENIKVLSHPFADNDRARAERRTEGMLKAVLGPKGKILGCGIVGSGAGELIAPWVLAMENGLKISALASTITPYPTRSEISKRAAGSYYTAALYGPRTRWLVRLLSIFG